MRGIQAPLPKTDALYRILSMPACADGLSAVEHRPADVVSQPLIIDDQFTNRIWELFTLPQALEPTGLFTLALRCSSPCSLDRVGSRTEFVCGDVGDSGSLSCGIGGMARSPFEVSGRCVGVTRRGASLRHRDFATHPRPGLVDSMARPQVTGLHRLEEMQDVLRARGCP
jgi:hypothetical protein